MPHHTIETESPCLLLRLGYEGGSVEIHTHDLAQLAPVWRESNEMSFDDNDDEIWVENRIEYADFNAYWQEFTDRELWFCGKPMLLHPAIRTWVQASLEQERTQLPDPRQLRRTGYIIRWLKAVADASAPR